MFWRKDTGEDTVELRRFVDGMKRGITPATNDSLLETLRQIHDRREAPAPTHDHRRMLLERLRREARVRAGEDIVDAVWVPQFAAPAPRRRFLELAIAASVIAHVALGAYVVTQRFIIGRATSEIAESRPPEVDTAYSTILTLPRVNDRRAPNQRPSADGAPSVGLSGQSKYFVPVSPAAPPEISPVPATSAAPIGPPVAPGGGAPIVPGFAAAGVEGQFDRNLPDDGGPGLAGPDEPRPWSEVGGYKAITSDFDVAPRSLFSPKPQYTEKALRYAISGTVRVLVTIASDGTVRDAEVKRSLGYGLDEAAIDAVTRSKFAPATRGGSPVTVRILVDVSFEIH